MEETLRAQLMELAAVFGEATGSTKPSIGKNVLSDNTFFRRIENGDGFTVKTFDKVVQWFADQWPESVDWPADIPRPLPSEPESERAAS